MPIELFSFRSFRVSPLATLDELQRSLSFVHPHPPMSGVLGADGVWILPFTRLGKGRMSWAVFDREGLE